MRREYYIYYPRNFANEYDIFYVETPAEKEEVKHWIDNTNFSKSDVHRITRKEAEKQMRWMKRESAWETEIHGNISFDSIESYTATFKEPYF